MIFTNDEVVAGCKIISDEIIKSKWIPNLILGLSRGGLAPSLYIHEMLKAGPHSTQIDYGVINIVRQSNRVGDKEYIGIETFASISNKLKHTSHYKVLVVDDIHDSGKTLEAVYGWLDMLGVQESCQATAVLHYKPKASVTQFKPTYFAHETEDWIVYPHENV